MNVAIMALFHELTIFYHVEHYYSHTNSRPCKLHSIELHKVAMRIYEYINSLYTTKDAASVQLRSYGFYIDLRARYAKHVSEIIEQASPIDLARSVSDVESRAAEMGCNVGKKTFQTVGVVFKRSSLSKKNLVGVLNLTENTKVIKP